MGADLILIPTVNIWILQVNPWWFHRMAQCWKRLPVYKESPFIREISLYAGSLLNWSGFLFFFIQINKE